MTRAGRPPPRPGAEQTASSSIGVGGDRPVRASAAHRPTTACPRTGSCARRAGRNPCRRRETFALPDDEHQADLAAAGLVRNASRRASAGGGRSRHRSSRRFRASHGRRGRCRPSSSPAASTSPTPSAPTAARRRDRRACRDRRTARRHRPAKPARDRAPERRAGGELEDRPGHADGDDRDAPPQRPEKWVLVVFQINPPRSSIQESPASRPYSLPPSSPASIPCGRPAPS